MAPSPPDASTVAAVVVTRGREAYLPACLEALAAQTARPRVIVVDNGAGLAPSVRAIAPDARVVSLPRNVGCAGGFARGLEEAAREGARFAWLLDDDCRPAPTALARLLDRARRSDAAGFEGQVLNHRERVPRAPAWLRSGRLATAALGPVRRGRRAGGTRLACFGNLLLRLAALSRVGLPHAPLWVYADDWELALRFADAGLTIEPVPESVTLHRYLAPRPRGPETRDAARYYALRNLTWMLRRHRPRLAGAAAAHLLARGALLAAVAGGPRAATRRWTTTWRGVRDGWRGDLGWRADYRL